MQQEKKKKIGKLCLKGAAAILTFWLFLVLSDYSCTCIGRFLEQKRPDYLYGYASDGRFTQNVYFSKEVAAEFNLPPAFSGKENDESLFVRAQILSRYQLEWSEILAQNQEYMRYLRGKGTSLTELFAFCEKLGGLSEDISSACRYLLFLAWVIFLHLLLRSRPILYFGMGLLCVLASIIKLSGKLFAVFLFGASSAYHQMADGLIPVLLEAMLTFLIFDISIAALETLRLQKKLQPLYEDLPALQSLITTLALHSQEKGEYRSDVSHVLPRFFEYAQNKRYTRKKAVRLKKAVLSLTEPHQNQEFLKDLLYLQSLLPPR